MRWKNKHTQHTHKHTHKHTHTRIHTHTHTHVPRMFARPCCLSFENAVNSSARGRGQMPSILSRRQANDDMVASSHSTCSQCPHRPQSSLHSCMCALGLQARLRSHSVQFDAAPPYSHPFHRSSRCQSAPAQPSSTPRRTSSDASADTLIRMCRMSKKLPPAPDGSGSSWW